MKKITIVAIDDHKFIREMWQLLFANHATYELTGTSGTIEDGLEMVTVKRPDIVLLDINLQDTSGMSIVPPIRKVSPGTKIIVISMHNEPAYAKKMIQLGAKGFVTKNSSHQEVFEAIENVLSGKTYICTEIKDTIAEQMMQIETDTPDIRSLSLREIEIIKFIKGGMLSNEIASELHLSTRTVEVHRHNILKKLKFKNTASMINFISTTDLSFN